MRRKTADNAAKRGIELLTFLAAVTALSTAAVAQGTLQSGENPDLAAEYRFDTGAGDTLYDTAGNNDGTINGASWTSGVEGKALSFEGDDEVTVSLSDSDEDNLGNDRSGTIAAWIRPESYSSSGTIWSTYIDRDRSLRLNNGVLEGDQYNGGASGRNSVSFDISSYSGWTHVAYHYNQNNANGNQELILWVDGERVNRQTFSGTSEVSNGADYYIGSLDGNSGFFNGDIQNIKFHKSYLNDSQIRSIYNSGSWKVGGGGTESETSKVLDMSFQHVQNGQVLDTSGESNHANIVNGASQLPAVECKVGRCFNFDESGNGQYVEADPASGLSDNEITAMAWIKPKPSADARAPIIRVDQFYFQHYSNDRLASYWYGWNKEGYHTSPSGSVPTGEWSHVAVTWDDSNGVSFYVDGQLTNQVSNTGPGDALNWIRIGRESSSRRFNGKIDQAKVFSSSLSSQELRKQYTQGRDRSSNAVPGAAARFGFDSSPRVCILNQGGGLSDGGWGGPSDSELKNLLDSEGWNTNYVQVGDITEDGWRSCDVIVFPNSERYPAFDKSADFCGSVNGEGSEHDVYMEMEEFMRAGGMWVGTWGAGLWYGKAWDGSSWNSYTSCSQYSGDELYKDGGGARCSDIGYSCYSSGNYDYSNINQSAAPALPNTITGAGKSTRWASNLDVKVLQAYDASSGYLIANKYVGIERVGDGYYFHPGGNYVLNPGSYSSADDGWNNLLTWYAGGGKQRIWDSAESNAGTINGDGNAPSYSSGNIGGAMTFDGSGDHIQLEEPVVMTKEGSTLIWSMNPDNTESTGLFTDGPTNLDNHIEVRTDKIFAETQTNCNYFDFGQYEKNTGWNTYAIVFNNSQAFLYENGKLLGEATRYGNNGCDGNSVDRLVSDMSFQYIGSKTGYNPPYDGQLDQIRTYPYALSQDQINQLMNNGGVSVSG